MALHKHPKHLDINGLGLDYNIFGEALAEATLALGHLDGSLKKLHNPELLVSPLTVKEATISSSIEGTQSTVSDVFLMEAGGKPKFSDTFQVVNYRIAMRYAIKEVSKGRRLSTHFIKSLHQILLKDVRHLGELGDFRKKTVWIGTHLGDPIENSLYVPPEYFRVNDYMDNLLDYLHKGKENILIKSGIAHYQFEAVHPFEDGNGRIGRLLIPLILFCNKQISHPILYASGYFEKHKNEYIDGLRKVDKSGTYESWLSFYLKSITSQLKETQQLIDNIYNLYDELKVKFDGTRSPFLLPSLDFIFKYPNFTKPFLKTKLKIDSNTTVNSITETLLSEKVIRDLKAKQHNAKIYSFYQLLNLIK